MLRRSILIALLSFVGANAAVLAAVHSMDLVDQPWDVQSVGLFRLALAPVGGDGPGSTTVFAGDSLTFGGHLAEGNNERWWQGSLSAQYARRVQRQSPQARSVNLGINGVVFEELDCVVAQVLARRPALLVINLRPRSFSSDFRQPQSEGRRPFLCAEAGAADLEERLSRLFWHALPVVKYRDLFQLAALGGTPTSTTVRATQALLKGSGGDANRVGEDEGFDDDEEELELLAAMAWKIKAAQRYNGIRVDAAHPQARHLDRMLRRVTSARDTRVTLFYLKEDVQAIAQQLDMDNYREQVARFTRFVERRMEDSMGVDFRVFEASTFAGLYTDHVHLNAEGYARLAQRLVALEEVEPP